MPSSKGLNPENKKKLNKVYAICKSSQEKYGYSNQKYEKCLLGLAKKMDIHREMKDDMSYQKKMCKC